MAVRRGKGDNFLIKAEKAANARGAREMGLAAGEDDGLELRLLDGREGGAIRGLYVCGDGPAGGRRRAAARTALLERSSADRPGPCARRWPSARTGGLAVPDLCREDRHVHQSRRARAADPPGHRTRPTGMPTDGEIFTPLAESHWRSAHERFEPAAVLARDRRDAAGLLRASRFERMGAAGAPLAGSARPAGAQMASS